MDRLIFHCDCNNFFASCEILERPELKDVPMAVAGDPDSRKGIVVAKNEIAKRYGVKTTDTVRQAMDKCPGIVFVPPRHGYYSEISRRVNSIYREYTEFVEPASIDESYLDLTGSLSYYNMTERELADTIRKRIKNEIGITISVGVSFNKIFAKMGSDYRKPDATTVITPENYREILWPLPVGELMLVGKNAAKVLTESGIRTIGDLANSPEELLRALLGKSGETLRVFANGQDMERVRIWGDTPEIKSASHGMTFPKDLETYDELRREAIPLIDRVADELRKNGKKAATIGVHFKTPLLRVYSKQIQLDRPTNLQHELRPAVTELIRKYWNGLPVRAFTVFAGKLSDGDCETGQISMFDTQDSTREKREKLEAAAAALKQKYGKNALTHGIMRESANKGKKQ